MPAAVGTGTRRARASRRWLWWLGGSLLGLCVLVVVGLLVVYPKVGAWMVRDKLGDKLRAKLGREIRFGPIDVALGHATLRDVEIRGARDGDTPLAHVDKIDVDFDTMSSLVGSVKLGAVAIDGVTVTLRRDQAGADNLRDVIDRLRAPAGGGGGGGSTMKPTSITIAHAKLLATDEQSGATALVADGSATWHPGELTAEAKGVSATTLNAPKASVGHLVVHKVTGQTPVITVENGEVALWPKLALTGVGGKIAADPASGHYSLDLAGGYGGVPGRLWTAKGQLDPGALTASLDLEAAKFQLDKLAPILASSAIVDYAETSVDTQMHVDVDRGGAKFTGNFHLRGLNVGHPLLADKEVHDLDLSGEIAGVFDRGAKKLDVTRGDFEVRGVPFSITGTAAAASAPLPEATPRGPHGVQQVQLRLVIPPIDCQRVLVAIPTEMAPYMAGYKMKGTFDADIGMAIDWSDLDATKLDGHIGLRNCRVLDEPADSPKKLKEEFEHYVEVDKGEWSSFVVGPTNPDFVPLDQISPYLIKSIMSTEDSGFMTHHGFIPSEFRTALINNLKKEKFVQGASSITMQMVKNVLLYREKTLARKLQELFLTWHVENTLTKDRILEIYLNVIEYGPGLYGIGPATQHYFGKPPKDLNPVEAAFFSTILPAPKERYKQYCAGTLTKWTTDKIQRILGIMLKRDRLTQAEYDTAMTTPLLFVKDGSESEEDCMKRVKKAIKNARPTNPLANPAEPPRDNTPPPKPHHKAK